MGRDSLLQRLDEQRNEAAEEPGQRDGEGEHQEEGGPVTQVVGSDVDQHEMDVDEIDFEGDAAHESEKANQPMGGMTEEPTHQEHAADSQGNVDHALGGWREGSTPMTFHIDAIPEGKEENNPHQTSPRGGFLLLSPSGELEGGLNPLSRINAQQEDGDAAPEDFYMADGFPERRPVAHQQIPENRHKRKPSPDAVALDKAHIEGGDEIECHDGGNEPEREVVDTPEAPAHQDVGNEMNQIGTVTAAIGPVLGNVIKTGNDEPCGIKAEEAPEIE